MKKLLILTALIALTTGCSPDREVVEIIKGDDGAPGADGSNGTSCYVEESEGGIALTCGDNTYYVSNGADGADGINGVDGINGINGDDCSVASVEGGAEITCGESTTLVSNGTNGINGTSSFETDVSSTCAAVGGLAGYSAKKNGSGVGAALRIYEDNTDDNVANCDNEVTSLTSTNELEILNVNTILLYQSSASKLVVLKVGN